VRALVRNSENSDVEFELYVRAHTQERGCQRERERERERVRVRAQEKARARARARE